MNECVLWMNVIYEWVRTTFLLKKCMILMFLMNALATNQQTDQQTDTAYYRDARTQLKNEGICMFVCSCETWPIKDVRGRLWIWKGRRPKGKKRISRGWSRLTFRRPTQVTETIFYSKEDTWPPALEKWKIFIIIIIIIIIIIFIIIIIRFGQYHQIMPMRGS